MKGIAESLQAFYARDYPELANADASVLEENVAAAVGSQRV